MVEAVAMRADGGLIIACTHSYLIARYVELDALERAGADLFDPISGYYDDTADVCYVVVLNPMESAKTGLTPDETFTAIHEHAHQEDYHSGKKASSRRWIYLRDNAPNHMTHDDINILVQGLK